MSPRRPGEGQTTPRGGPTWPPRAPAAPQEAAREEAERDAARERLAEQHAAEVAALQRRLMEAEEHTRSLIASAGSAKVPRA